MKNGNRLSTLWNYTALKPDCVDITKNIRLSTLWNYTALKHKNIAQIIAKV